MRTFHEYQLDELMVRLHGSLPFTRKINTIHIHHTAEPNKRNYKGLETIKNIYQYHTKTRGWSDIGYHWLISPEGTIWVGRDPNRDPASITNYNKGALAIALIGNFDTEILEEPQKITAIELTKFLLSTFQLEAEKSIFFHKEKSATACPGKNIKKEDFLSWLKKEKELLDVQIRPIEIKRKGKTYKGYLFDNKAYVEVRELIEDLGGKVQWVDNKVIIS